jgi:hypothetical protein
MSKFPEHEKLRECKQEKQLLTNFLEWLEENNRAVFEFNSGRDAERECCFLHILTLMKNKSKKKDNS